MEIERESLSIAQEEVTIARSAFRPVFSASVAQSKIRTPAGEDFPQTMSEGVDSSVGLSQHLATGADVGVGVGLNRSANNPAFATLNPAYASDLTLAVRQPLLKGFGTSINRLGIDRAEITTGNAETAYRANALDLIQRTENAYYAVGGAREQLRVFEASLTLAQKLQMEAESRERAGMSTHLDVLQAQLGVSNARRNILQADAIRRDSEDALLALLGRFELDAPLGNTRFEESGAEARERLDVIASYDRAKAHNPDLEVARATLDLAQLDLKSAKDELKPSLDLDVAYGVNGTDSVARDALDAAVNRDGDSWQAGLSIRYPIGRSGEKAQYRQAGRALNRQQLIVSELEQQILLGVRSAVRDVETQIQSVKLAADAADLSHRQYDRELARFKAGLTASRRVLEAQTDLETARVAHVQARLDLQRALASLHRLEGSAADRYGIDLAANQVVHVE